MYLNIIYDKVAEKPVIPFFSENPADSARQIKSMLMSDSPLCKTIAQSYADYDVYCYVLDMYQSYDELISVEKVVEELKKDYEKKQNEQTQKQETICSDCKQNAED